MVVAVVEVLTKAFANPYGDGLVDAVGVAATPYAVRVTTNPVMYPFGCVGWSSIIDKDVLVLAIVP